VSARQRTRDPYARRAVAAKRVPPGLVLLRPQAWSPSTPPSTPTTVREGKGSQANNATGRVPLTTGVRADYAAALKRASLERQLGGQSPNTLHDIRDEALEPWLRSHGYLN